MDFIWSLVSEAMTALVMGVRGHRGLGLGARNRRTELYARGERVVVPVRWEDRPTAGTADGSPVPPLSSIPATISARTNLVCERGHLAPARGWPLALGDFLDFWHGVAGGMGNGSVTVIAEGERTAIHVPGTGFRLSPVLLFTTSDFRIVLDCLDAGANGTPSERNALAGGQGEPPTR